MGRSPPSAIIAASRSPPSGATNVTDGRHAEVAWTDDWAVDAARRDFTFNAMSMTRDGAVFDYFDGRADLAAGRVRFVGEPAARIAEDYLRILRFFRFQARYGQQPPDAETVAALRGGIDGLARLSPERVWSEFKRILVAPDPVGSVRLMAELGVLEAILPGADAAGLDSVMGAPADPILRLAALVPATCGRRATLADVDGRGSSAGSACSAGPAVGPSRRRLATHPRRHPGLGPDRPLLARRWRRRRARQSPTGRRRAPDFRAGRPRCAGARYAPGPAVGELIRSLRDWWLAGGCVASPAECRAELARRVASEFRQG